jgi:hypothetical protein
MRHDERRSVSPTGRCRRALAETRGYAFGVIGAGAGLFLQIAFDGS